MNYYEIALGTKSRSGQQWDIWEAVFSPAGEDGYPKRIFDKLTGDIDPKVAEYWREHYDLRHIMQRDWARLGPKLRGKIHLYCGTLDNYYLNNAVKLTEEFLENATNPPAEAEVKYGVDCEHCWNGDPSLPNHITRLRYIQCCAKDSGTHPEGGRRRVGPEELAILKGGCSMRVITANKANVSHEKPFGLRINSRPGLFLYGCILFLLLPSGLLAANYRTLQIAIPGSFIR